MIVSPADEVKTMRRLIVISLLLLFCFAACAGRERGNATCQWRQEDPISLDLRNPEHQLHLNDDALLAEDVAVRYADSGNWIAPGQPWEHGAYVRSRDECLATLFSLIAKNHGVSLEQVRGAVRQRRMSFDLAVLFSFAVFYFLVAYHFAKQVCRRFPLREGRLTALFCTIGASILVSLIGFLALETLSFITESLYLGNKHLSDRANRIPWAYIRLPLFVGGMFLFWLAAALRYRTGGRGAEVDDFYCTLRLHH